VEEKKMELSLSRFLAIRGSLRRMDKILLLPAKWLEALDVLFRRKTS
jgi:hypothetical protein